MENQIAKSSHTSTPPHPHTPKKKQSFFFILGRNPQLSRHEILEYLKARNRTHKEILFQNNLLIIEFNQGERFDIQEFGGILHLGEITFQGTEEQLKIHLIQNEIIPSDKFTYATFGNHDPQTLKEKFKSEHKKAAIKHGRKLLKFEDGTKQENPKADHYIFFHSTNNQGSPELSLIEGQPTTNNSESPILFLGVATQTYNPQEVKKRDMQKPIRREHLAISPRLSKILINLSGAKPHDRLLDPFCGIGGILSEALIKRINTHGIDKDKDATQGAKTNLHWLTKQYNIKTKYQIENKDSRRAPDLQFSCIATETPLGKVLRKKPSDNQAKQIITNFEAYMIPILRHLKRVKKSGAKIAITFPVIRNLHTDHQKIAKKSGLKIYMEPILESRKDQFISRDILILQ